jgi:uncharacterized protein (TIGR03437 family)
MLRTRSSIFFLAVLALSLGAGTASAQVLSASPTSVSITYAKGSGIVNAGTTSISADVDGSAYTAISPTTWLSSTPTSGLAGTVADTLTLAAVPSVADHMAAGVYTTSVPLVGGTTSVSVSVTLTITGPSPLSGGPVSLSYVSHGVANQTGIHGTAAISSNDTLADTYTIQSSSVPSWLTVSAGSGQASRTSTDTIAFTVVPSAANSLSAGMNTANVHLQISGQSDYVLAVNLYVYAQNPLTTSTTADNFAYTVGSSTVPSAQTASIAVPTGSVAFTLDQSTVPAWLTATGSGTATTSGTTVTFTPVGTVVKGLAAGNYSASIGYQAQYAQSELLIPVVLTVSNPTATISLKGSAHNTAILNFPGATVPQPVVTVVSSNEPTGFSATCTVTTTNPTYVPIPTTCSMAGASTPGSTVTGVAYTFGTPLTTTFDPLLFATGTPFGTVVTETVTVTAGSQSPVQQTFAYTIQPIAPTFTALSPTSAAQIASGQSLVVTLTGTNFVGPGSILGSSISPTKVFVGTTDVTSFAIVVSSTVMMVSVPQVDFPAYPTGKTTVNMVLGVANQTAATAPTTPTATQNVVVTTAPVIYALTSTATYKQPNPGGKPVVAPYELVSIFGANFGVTGSVNGTLSTFSQFATSVVIGGSGTSTISLAVTFKVGSTVYKSPILFANATQINCIVPAGLTVGGTAAVTVTSGTAASDGLFSVNVVAADPGIFTLASDGIGQGAILNSDMSVNGTSAPAHAGDIVAIYLTGLGIPNSAATDAATNPGGYPTGCVAINGTTNAPGYLQVVNTSTKTYTAPTTPWTNIDGAVMNQAMLLGSALPPCFTAAPLTTVTVTFGSTPVTGTGLTGIAYAGFAPSSVAGLYQINVKVPNGLTPGSVPVVVTLGTEGSSPAGVVSIAVQ